MWHCLLGVPHIGQGHPPDSFRYPHNYPPRLHQRSLAFSGKFCDLSPVSCCYGRSRASSFPRSITDPDPPSCSFFPSVVPLLQPLASVSQPPLWLTVSRAILFLAAPNWQAARSLVHQVRKSSLVQVPFKTWGWPSIFPIVWTFLSLSTWLCLIYRTKCFPFSMPRPVSSEIIWLTPKFLQLCIPITNCGKSHREPHRKINRSPICSYNPSVLNLILSKCSWSFSSETRWYKNYHSSIVKIFQKGDLVMCQDHLKTLRITHSTPRNLS